MLFSKNELKPIIGDTTAISDDMYEKIREWRKMLAGDAPWCGDYVKSLRLERGICREFANTAVLEMESSVSVPKLDDIYKSATEHLREKLGNGLGLGSMIIKPLGGSKVEYVSADRFIPLEFDDEERLVKVCFIDVKRIANDNYYYRFEQHSLVKNILTITHIAYHSRSASTIGHRCRLDEVAEWAALPEQIAFPVDRPIYGFYKNPLPNDIDGSPCGISIFDIAADSICKADKQYGRLDWEFESGERAIHVDETALRSKPGADGKLALPSLNKRLYRGLDISVGDGKELFDVFSPEFRDSSLRSGLEEYKRSIEFAVGLSYGDLSAPQFVEKTATEINSAKQRKYDTVTAIQNNLKSCLDGLVYGLAFMNGYVNSGYEFVCNFKDSILTDEATERAQDRQDVSMGVMPTWEYRMKWYAEDEATAKAMTGIDDALEVVE